MYGYFCYLVAFMVFGLCVLHLIQMSYYLQLDGYNCKALLVAFSRLLYKKQINCFYVLLVLMVFVFVSNIFWIDVLYLILSLALFGYYCVDYSVFKKIVLTRRLCRILVLSVLLLLSFFCFLFLCVRHDLFFILLPVSIIFDYLFILASLFLLLPIEKIIGHYYIHKAKKIIASNTKLIKVGITGSFGKTSTKEILMTILAEYYDTIATPRSYNTPFGISKTIISSFKDENEVFVCEIGAKRRGDISFLCKTYGCDCGIITAVGRQHLKTFRSIDGVYNTKKELLDYLDGRMCVFNLMNGYTHNMYRHYNGKKIGVYVCIGATHSNKLLIKSKRIYSVNRLKNYSQSKYYAYSKNNAVFAKKIVCDDTGTSFDIYSNEKYFCSTKIELIGIYNVINVLLSVALAIHLKVPKKYILIGLRKIHQISARCERRVAPNGAMVINNGYNSNIDSCKYVFETLSCYDKKYKVIVTPGIVETGNDYEYNKIFGNQMTKYCTDIIIVKESNRRALLDGIKASGFDMSRVKISDNIRDVLSEINKANSDYVYLLENDLPDNYL